jgi:hypothetical protein
MPDDAMLPSVRRRGTGGGDRTAICEWSPEGQFDRTDRRVWYNCNPALGIRIQEWFLAQQLQAFTEAGSPEKFDTEHLGLWPRDAEEQWQVIGEAEWADAWDPQSQIAGQVAFGLDVSWNRGHAAIATAGDRADGKRHVELVKYAAGTGWCVEYLKERVSRWRPCAVVIQPGSPAGSLIPELEAAGIEVLKPAVGDVGKATGALFDAVAGKDLEARNLRACGLPELPAAVAGAVWRKVGDAMVWDRQAAKVDVSPLVAVTLANFGYATNARPVYSNLNSVW